VKRSSVISVESVSKHYETPAGVVRAVDDLSFDVEPGSSLAITGPSGCGKSTLLSLIGGLETPTTGRIVLDGVSISKLSERERDRLRRHELGFVFQADNLLPFLTAVENVALQLALQAKTDTYEQCRDLLAKLGLADGVDKLPDQLSGGQRQRVAVARALIQQPIVILADEPTGSLDAHNSAIILDLLLAAQRDAGTTLIVVTHDESVARRLDQTLRLRDGRLAEHAPFSHPAVGRVGA